MKLTKEEQRLKRDLITLLSNEPRERWVSVIMQKYGRSPDGRVATFHVFCLLDESGELDKIKAAAANQKGKSK